MCSLYVSNLHPKCTEAMLFKKFSPLGTVLNIHMFKDSTCCAYVQFARKSDAEKALSVLNHKNVKKGTPRVMWAQEDAPRKYPETANLFVRNLHQNIDDKILYDIFRCYGSIASLKVARDDDGKSKGHAFVQFKEETSAKNAILDLDHKIIVGKVVCVSRFIAREKLLEEIKFRNIYLTNFRTDFSDKDLMDLCEKFGTIMSAKVMVDENGVSRGFGFVCFDECVSANEAIRELNGKLINGRKLFVGLAKRKSESQ